LNKKQLLFENVFIYGFSSVVSKIIPFIFLPIVLNLLNSPSAYGIYTTYITIIGFGTPLVVFGMYDAVFREYFEFNDQEYKNKVLSTSLRFIALTSIIIIFLFVIGSELIAGLFGITDIKIVFLALVSIVISGFSTIFAMPTRLKNDRKTYVIMSAVIPVILYLISLITLFYGFSYYGLIIASVSSNQITLTTYFIMNNKYFNIRLYSKIILTKLLKVAIPLVPLFLIYWIYNSMDRIMIVQLLGLNDLGMYSVAAKFGSISAILYSAFAGGFQHFSFSTMKEFNQVKNNTKLLNLVLYFSSVSMAFMNLIIDVLYKIFLPMDYIGASTSTIFLFISPLLLLSFQIIANQFLIIRKTYILLLSLFIGLVFNLVLNIVLIPMYGVLGASFATFIGFYFNFIFIGLFSVKRKLIYISRQLILNAISILVMSLVIFFFNEWIIKIFLLISSFLLLNLVNYNILITIFNFFKLKFFGKSKFN
jgi:O-antigen/teichoic acid export membrane protein